MAVRFISNFDPDVSDPSLWYQSEELNDWRMPAGNIVVRDNDEFQYADRAIHHQLQVIGIALNIAPTITLRSMLSTPCLTPSRCLKLDVLTRNYIQLVTDRYVFAYTESKDTDYSDIGLTMQPGDLVTYGAGSNWGLFVKLSTEDHGLAIARVDKHDPSAGLLFLTFKPEY